APRWWDAGGPDTARAAGPAADVLAPAGPAAPVLGRLRTYRVGPDIDPTGTRDVTDALLAFFRRVPDGSRVLFPVRSRYRIEGTVELDGRSRLLVDGAGS